MMCITFTSLSDILPQVKTLQVECADGCVHEVAIPNDEEYQTLQPTGDKPAKV